VRATPGGDNLAMPTSLAHEPAVALFLVGVVVAAGFTTVVNLRNVPLWLLQVTGRRAEGVVQTMEFATGDNFQPLRRPVVAFTTHRGERIVGKPALYRRSTYLAAGMTVAVRYAAGDPTRMVVPGFGFRYREPVYACLGAAVAIGISVRYFLI
jgi:hypothetical protein